MRIAVFTSQFPTRVSTFFARDIRALSDAGAEVEIFAIYPRSDVLWNFVPRMLVDFPRNRIHHLSIRECVPLIARSTKRAAHVAVRTTMAVGWSALAHGPMALAKSLYVVPKAWAWASGQNASFDQVLSYWGNYAATCAYLFSQIRQIPFSLFLHAGTDLYRGRILLREKLLAALNIVVVCEFNRQFLARTYPDFYPTIEHKIHVHHLGLDLNELYCDTSQRPLGRVLAVGSHEKNKGFQHLIRAIRILRDRGVGVTLDLVGDGPQSKALKLLVRDLELGECVRFHGWLAPDEVPAHMTKATVLVHPSTELGDAVPTVLKESMALGTPVIASDVAGIPELLDGGRCGLLVPPRNEDVLAGAIQMLVENERLRRDLAAAARKHAEAKFDMWRNGRRLFNILAGTDATERGFERIPTA